MEEEHDTLEGLEKHRRCTSWLSLYNLLHFLHNEEYITMATRDKAISDLENIKPY